MEDLHEILQLWSIRLACLRRLGFYAIMSSESSALFSALGAPYTRPLVHTSDETFFNSVYPFHLVQLWALSPLFVGGDRFLVIRQLREVAHGCKHDYRRTKNTVWKENLISTMLILANILLDMQEYAQVERILRAVKEESKDVASMTYLFLFYLDMGNVERASSLLDGLADMPQGKDQQKALKRILQLAHGQVVAGEDQLDLSEDSEDLVGQNNLAVSCLYSGRIGHVRIDFPALDRSDQTTNRASSYSKLRAVGRLRRSSTRRLAYRTWLHFKNCRVAISLRTSSACFEKLASTRARVFDLIVCV